jgi:hypothetical protein
MEKEEKIFQLFKILDEYEELNKTLEKFLQNGYLDLLLAKRNKYLEISTLDIPKFIEPGKKFIWKNDLLIEKNDLYDHNENIENTILKKRKNKNVINEKDSILNKNKTDPINWFSKIHTKDLFLCQNNFHNSLNIILKLSNLNIKIDNLINEIKNLDL